MLTIEGLKEYGANVEEGLARCMGNADFYIMLVKKVLEDANFEKLDRSILFRDFDSAFEAAHSLKGVLGNLALTPLCEPVMEITELLRNRSDVDYSSYLKVITKKKCELEALCKR